MADNINAVTRLFSASWFVLVAGLIISMLTGRNKRRLKKIVRPFSVRVNRLMFREILVLGDSHVNVFRDRRFAAEFPGYFFNIVRVGGATVSGLKNPNSGTMALPIFKKEIKRSKADTVITLIGEVDTGFVIWYRAQKYNASVDAICLQALENYKGFLADIVERKNVICISVPLPTIQDDNDWGEVANLRKEVGASQKERTDLTLKFNKCLQEICNDIGINYLSLDKESMGNDGLVSPHLLNDDRNDHHYDRAKYADMIITKLKGHIPQPIQSDVVNGMNKE